MTNKLMDADIMNKLTEQNDQQLDGQKDGQTVGQND